MELTRLQIARMQEERQQKRQATQTPEDEGGVMQRFAEMFRAARTGFPPAQPGTVQGAAQQMRQPGMQPMGQPQPGQPGPQQRPY